VSEPAATIMTAKTVVWTIGIALLLVVLLSAVAGSVRHLLVARSAGRAGEPASGVRDEFEQAAVGVAEVHACSFAARTLAAHRPEFDLHAVGPQVVDRAFDWSRPEEAEIASARLDRKPRNRDRFKAGSMDV
jgi:hypothetical protein